MRRRDLIAAGTAVALAAPASTAFASGGAEPAEAGAVTMNIAGVGLPVITEGRIRNYVFVTVKVTLGEHQTLETARAKEPFFRDAIMRTAHRAPFTVADDWTRLNDNAINAAVVAIGDVLLGRGGVASSEVLIQAPRRRTGVIPA